MKAPQRGRPRRNAERDRRIADALRRGRTLVQMASSHRLSMTRIREIAQAEGVSAELLNQPPRGRTGGVLAYYEISAETREHWRHEAVQHLRGQLRMGIPEAEAREGLAL